MTSDARPDVTFLLTDIEGSTRQWEERPGEMSQALALHDDLLSTEIDRYSGRVVKAKGEGDSVFAVFSEPGNALSAACAIQRTLLDTHSALRVRIAIHTGVAEERAGDYFGPTVNRCARLRAAAHGGQVLISGSTERAVHKRLPEGIGLRPLGEHRLKDVSGAERIFQLIHSRLPSEFGALRTVELTPHNLPEPLTSFVGRHYDVTTVARLLTDGRLVTLLGAGGVGKTRLALQVARETLGQYPDGAWLVDLAPLADPSLLPARVANVLRIMEQPGQRIETTLSDALHDRELLLLLDNCEHLILACASLAEALLRSCPRVRILATSREALHVDGERTWRTPSLPDEDSVVLFADRAASGGAFLEPTDDTRAWVRKICDQLDGIPLALELAAAKLQVLTLAQISDRLEDRFRLLQGGSRTALPRHQTLRGTIDWSFSLLALTEQTVLRRLSVFVGGFGLEAAESIAGAAPVEADAVLGILSALVDKSLIIADRTVGMMRYRILETIRQYGMEKLKESGEDDAVRGRHFDWFLALAEGASLRPKAYSDAESWGNFELELDNLRGALDWSIGQEPESALRLTVALHPFWDVRGYWNEARDRIERAMMTAKNPPDDLCASAFAAAADVAANQGDRREALSHCESALAGFHKTGDTKGRGRTLNIMGRVLIEQDELERARGVLTESCRLLEQVGDARGHAEAVYRLADVAEGRGEIEEAERLCQESLGIRRGLGDLQGMAQCLGSLGNLAAARKDWTRARSLLSESIDRFRLLGDEPNRRFFESRLGTVARREGDLERSARMLASLVAESEEVGDTRALAANLCELGTTHALLGNGDHATQLVSRSLTIYLRWGERAGVDVCLRALALVALRDGDPERAARLLGASERIRKEIQMPLPAPEREAYDDQVRLVADRLGARWQELWQSGRAMPLETLAAFALGTSEARGLRPELWRRGKPAL
jgi:predicted ATPase/class 3 adenylate cyclase